MAEKETVILDFQIEQGDAISELERTKVSIINLKKEQQELNKAYKEGNITVEEYASESVRLEGILKKQTNQYAQVQKSVTGVKTQFDKLIESNQGINASLKNSSASLAQIVPGFASLQGGITSATTASKAFIATPIGAVIGALGLAVTALTSYFRDNETGQNRFNTLMNIGAAIVGKLTDAVSALGEFLFDNLAKGFEIVINFLSKWVPGFDAATQAVKQFLNLDRANFISNLQAETDILERQLIVQKALLESKVAENKLRAEDKSLDVKERLKALEDAKRAQQELNDLELKFAENKLKIIQETNKQSNSNKEALKQEAEAEAQLFRVRKDAADKQKEIFTKTQELKAQEKANIDKANAAIAEEIRLKNQLIEVNTRLAQQSENEIQQQPVQIKGKLDLNAANRAVESANKKAADALAQANFEREIAIRDTQLYANSLGALGQVMGQQTALSRALSSAQAIINTYLGATNVLTAKPPLPFPLNVLALTATIASGLAAVAKINDVSFAAGGGSFLTKGPTALVVGDNPGGVERVTVEPVSGRGQTIVGNGMIRLAGGGVVETQAQTSGARTSFNFARMFDRTPVIYASWTEARELENRVRFKENLVTR